MSRFSNQYNGGTCPALSTFCYAGPTVPQVTCTNAGRPFVGSLINTVAAAGPYVFYTNEATNGYVGYAAASTQCSFTMTSGLMPDGDFIQIDLVNPTAVREISVYNTHEPTLVGKLAGFAIYVGSAQATTTVAYNRWRLGAQCDPSQLPATIDAGTAPLAAEPSVGLDPTTRLPVARAMPATTGFAARFKCSAPTGLVGRYVTLVVPPGSVVAVNEIMVWANNSCPLRTAVNALPVAGAPCGPGARLGDQCAHTCNAGFVQVWRGCFDMQRRGVERPAARLPEAVPAAHALNLWLKVRAVGVRERLFERRVGAVARAL
jgi:hypothetical protein